MGSNQTPSLRSCLLEILLNCPGLRFLHDSASCCCLSSLTSALGPPGVCPRPYTSGPHTFYSSFLNIFKIPLRYLGTTGVAVLSGQGPRTNILVDPRSHVSPLGCSLISSLHLPYAVNQMPQTTHIYGIILGPQARMGFQKGSLSSD